MARKSSQEAVAKRFWGKTFQPELAETKVDRSELATVVVIAHFR